MRVLTIIAIILFPYFSSADDAVEAASSCVVIHENSNSDGNKNITCFENISLERSSFESGVCRWKTDAQELNQTKVTTRFVSSCPISYSAYCDRLILGPAIMVPVKIFIYDKSEVVIERAKRQCLSGGGNWTVADKTVE